MLIAQEMQMTIEEIEKHITSNEIDRDRAIAEMFRMTVENNSMLKVIMGNLMVLMGDQMGVSTAFKNAVADQVDALNAGTYEEIFSKA